MEDKLRFCRITGTVLYIYSKFNSIPKLVTKVLKPANFSEKSSPKRKKKYPFTAITPDHCSELRQNCFVNTIQKSHSTSTRWLIDS